MKILRIFGVVVGVHVFALMLIFANPGCSSTNKPPPPSDTATTDEENSSSASAANDYASPVSRAPESAPVDLSTASTSEGVRFSPTRPNTPAASMLEAQPVSDVTPATTYTVVAGDSLWTIARRNKLSVAEVAAANNIRANATVRIGQKLIIPGQTMAGSSVSVMDPSTAKAPVERPAATRSSGEAVKHVVRPGETLGAIARKYQVKVGEIATVNNIADPAKIRPGMELTIPGWQAPGGRARTASATPVATTATRPAPPPVAEEPAVAEIPTLIIPSDPDAGNTSSEPPVIKVDDQ